MLAPYIGRCLEAWHNLLGKMVNCTISEKLASLSIRYYGAEDTRFQKCTTNIFYTVRVIGSSNLPRAAKVAVGMKS